MSSGIRIALRKRNEISQKEGSSENRIVLFVLVLILIYLHCNPVRKKHISPCQFNSHILNIYFISIWINGTKEIMWKRTNEKITTVSFICYLSYVISLSKMCFTKAFSPSKHIHLSSPQILVGFMLLVFDFLPTVSVCPFVLFLLPLYCLSFFDLRLLIAIMVASIFVLCFHVWETFTFATFFFRYSSFRN